MSVYPPQRLIANGARIIAVEPDSPAYDAGFEPGCYVTSVNGEPLRDVLDWRWRSAEDVITVGYVDLDGDEGEIELERDWDETWGFSFEGAVFDGVRLCRNACTFCFMHQLPKGMRPSLSLRDDDYRLSFLSGTFVTFTNICEDDEQRILEQRISPLRMSLHAVDANVRQKLIGKHAAHGLAVAERLLSGGIELYCQIVLVPGVNDGEVLQETLEWAYSHPGIQDICIVPLGYTDHQDRFSRSFNAPAAAQAVLDQVRLFQQRALADRGRAWVYAADEFYRNAYGTDLLSKLPESAFYGDFSMFEDGVGLIRSFVDDWNDAVSAGLDSRLAAALDAADSTVRYLVGAAMEPWLTQLIAASALKDRLVPLVVENRFFGGNVDVTGLLCGCDIAASVKAAMAGPFAKNIFILPRIVFNDDDVTLDDLSIHDIETAAGTPIMVVSAHPMGFIRELLEAVPEP